MMVCPSFRLSYLHYMSRKLKFEFRESKNSDSTDDVFLYSLTKTHSRDWWRLIGRIFDRCTSNLFGKKTHIILWCGLMMLLCVLICCVILALRLLCCVWRRRRRWKKLLLFCVCTKIPHAHTVWNTNRMWLPCRRCGGSHFFQPNYLQHSGVIHIIIFWGTTYSTLYYKRSRSFHHSFHLLSPTRFFLTER